MLWVRCTAACAATRTSSAGSINLRRGWPARCHVLLQRITHSGERRNRQSCVAPARTSVTFEVHTGRVKSAGAVPAQLCTRARRSARRQLPWWCQLEIWRFRVSHKLGMTSSEDSGSRPGLHRAERQKSVATIFPRWLASRRRVDAGLDRWSFVTVRSYHLTPGGTGEILSELRRLSLREYTPADARLPRSSSPLQETD
jgi:hypothetical protein